MFCSSPVSAALGWMGGREEGERVGGWVGFEAGGLSLRFVCEAVRRVVWGGFCSTRNIRAQRENVQTSKNEEQKLHDENRFHKVWCPVASYVCCRSRGG